MSLFNTIRQISGIIKAAPIRITKLLTTIYQYLNHVMCVGTKTNWLPDLDLILGLDPDVF